MHLDHEAGGQNLTFFLISAPGRASLFDLGERRISLAPAGFSSRRPYLGRVRPRGNYKKQGNGHNSALS